MELENNPGTQAGTESQNANPNDQGGTGGILGDGEVAPQGGQGSEPKGQNTPDEFASLKLPEGAQVDEKFFGDVKVWAKESGIKPEALQKLVDRWGARFTESMKEQEKFAKEARDKQVKEWVSELSNDKAFGGERFKENVTGLRAFLNKTDPDKSFRKAIVEGGIDNWPPLVRFLHSLAQANKDDSVLGSLDKAPKTAMNDEQTFQNEMYPSMREQGA